MPGKLIFQSLLLEVSEKSIGTVSGYSFIDPGRTELMNSTQGQNQEEALPLV